MAMLRMFLLLSLCASSLGVIAWIVLQQRQRRAVMRRVLGTNDAPAVMAPTEGTVARSLAAEVMDWLAARVPAQLGAGEVSASRLTHAGYSRTSDQAVYALMRVVSLLLFPAVALAAAPADNPVLFVSIVVSGIASGLLIPPTVLNQMAQSRQWAIRRGIPDALDVLVVCVEAGVPLDSAMQRVARELMTVHPILSREFLGMTRRISAGMPREQALHQLYLRTGVEELRGLGSHLLQSDRWGTSIATVLRIYSDQVRHKRRTAAEKRAATAATRMLIPLMLFIFPTMFIVLLAPAVMQINSQF